MDIDIGVELLRLSMLARVGIEYMSCKEIHNEMKNYETWI